MRAPLILLLLTVAACGGGNGDSAPPTPRDTTPPVLTLIGDDPQIIEAGGAYIELGATASDNVDGDLSALIVIDASAVVTMVPGDYNVTYDVSDSSGNAAATVSRTVRVQNPPLPAAPSVSIEGDIKTLIFSWDAVAGADYYRLLENADGHSGFTPVGDDIAADTLTATRDIAVHLFDWIEAQYLVEACNLEGCTASPIIEARDAMLSSIGFLLASNGDPADAFGVSIAISDDGRTIAVGATGEDSIAAGINGDESDNSGGAMGAVYLFRFDGTKWFQQAYVKPSNNDLIYLLGRSGPRFGGSVALNANGNTLAVGASWEDGAATGVNGDQSDQTSYLAGAVYLYRFDGTNWYQQAYIKASNTDKSDYFGVSVALSDGGDTLAVGARGEGSSASEINGDQDDNSAGDTGAVYLFRFDGVGWSQEAYIKASNPGNDYFGWTLALNADGNTLAVGAWSEDSSAVGVNGNQDDNSAGDAGAVYLFRFDGVSWYQEAYIKASNTDMGDRFGRSIALNETGDCLAVGAPFEDGFSTGINGDQDDNSAPGSGAAYLFRLGGVGWYQEAYIKASNTDAGDFFGYSVALNGIGDSLVVGSSSEESRSEGVNGEQNDNSSLKSGAAYFFRHDGVNWYQNSYIKSLNNESGGEFGYRVALSADGKTLVVGEHHGAADLGAAYIY